MASASASTTTTTTTTTRLSAFAALLGKWSGDCQLVDLSGVPTSASPLPCSPLSSSSSTAPAPAPAPATATTTTTASSTSTSSAVITVKASVVPVAGTDAGEGLELRLSCTTPDGLTSKEEFTFTTSATTSAPTATAESRVLRCVKYTGAKYAEAGISLQAEGQGLYLLKVTDPEQADLQPGYIRVQTFHVTSAGEFVSSWQTFDRPPQAGAKAPKHLSGVGVFKASAVEPY